MRDVSKGLGDLASNTTLVAADYSKRESMRAAFTGADVVSLPRTLLRVKANNNLDFSVSYPFCGRRVLNNWQLIKRFLPSGVSSLEADVTLLKMVLGDAESLSFDGAGSSMYECQTDVSVNRVKVLKSVAFGTLQVILIAPGVENRTQLIISALEVAKEVAVPFVILFSVPTSRPHTVSRRLLVIVSKEQTFSGCADACYVLL